MFPLSATSTDVEYNVTAPVDVVPSLRQSNCIFIVSNKCYRRKLLAKRKDTQKRKRKEKEKRRERERKKRKRKRKKKKKKKERKRKREKERERERERETKESTKETKPTQVWCICFERGMSSFAWNSQIE